MFVSLPLPFSIVKNRHKFCNRRLCWWGMVGQYLDAFFGIVMTWAACNLPFFFVLSLWPVACTSWTFFSCSLVNQHPFVS